ncbi:hypothetical protein MFLAVUS_009045 [Mucor flavus]|uniref:Uncharacterized protein n=1 Tax=Mucor flavus TaxID=439312 RepID=A0ABP9Z8T8_9FUNG
MQPHPDDRRLVEQEIKDAVKEILDDENSGSSLKNVASVIAISQFRIFRSTPINNYWNLGDESLEVYNTRVRVEQPATTNDEDVLEIDGVILDGMEKSVGSTLKSEAIKLAKAAGTFSNLSEEAKDTVYLGLNSIIDLL